MPEFRSKFGVTGAGESTVYPYEMRTAEQHANTWAQSAGNVGRIISSTRVENTPPGKDRRKRWPLSGALQGGARTCWALLVILAVTLAACASPDATAVTTTTAVASTTTRPAPTTTVTTAEPATVSTTTTSTPDAPSAETVAQAVTTASTFLEAMWGYEMDLADSYLAAGADISQLSWGGKDWRFISRLKQAEGRSITIGECEATPTPSGRILVECGYSYQNLGSDRLGLGPYEGSFMRVVIQDGEVVQAGSGRIEYESNGFSTQVWEPFAQWIAETHPDDVLRMYADSTQSLERLTEESIQLWGQRVNEYVASHT